MPLTKLDPANENQAEKLFSSFRSVELMHKSANRAHLTIMTNVRNPSKQNMLNKK